MSELQNESPPVKNRWTDAERWHALGEGDTLPTSDGFRTIEIRVEGALTLWRALPPEGAAVEYAADGRNWRLSPRKTVQVFQSAPDAEADAARRVAKQEQQFERHVIEWAKGQYLALFEAEPEAPASPAPVEQPSLDAEAEAALTTDDLIAESDEVASDVISKLTRDRRRRITEQLNVELAELQQNRDGPKEDRKREAKIERLLGIFARAGEM